MRILLTATVRCIFLLGFSTASVAQGLPIAGDVERGRLAFGPCRTCHYAESYMGHNNGPNLSRIFGKVAGKQEGFEYYSAMFKAAQFVWTPQLMFAWLEDPLAMFPDSSMMSFGVKDPQRRADLIAFLQQASVRGYSQKEESAEQE
ncbi:MAG: cytochrome c [Halioglobus sp.]|jgi:cytochrome c